jgi:predicted nucleic acid-binding protein
MKVIVDTNIIFSALLKKNSFFGELLLRDSVDYMIPKFAYIELFKYKEKIAKLSRLSEDELWEVLYRLLKKIDIFDEEMITTNTLREAYELVKDVDEKDMIFTALAIEVDGYLWTADEKLKNGLIRKGFNRFFDYRTLINNNKE